MSEEDKWLKEVMSKVIDHLGAGSDARYELSQPATSAIISSQLYVRVRFKDKSGEKSLEEEDGQVSLVLKRSFEWNDERNVELKRLIHVDSQFYNELTFYRTYAQPSDNLPRCFYMDYRPPSDSVIALENVCERGYQHCPHTTDIPLEYTLAAVRELARFHGKGYALKESPRREKTFREIVAGFQKIKWQDDTRHNPFVVFIERNSSRAVEYLRRRDYDADFCAKVGACLSDAVMTVMAKALAAPHEPLATLCHGDFTLNNAFFRTTADGTLRAMLIDFGCVTYATPASDLSTYLCIYYPAKLDERKFHAIMRAYHDELRNYLLHAGVWHAAKYSYDAFLDDYRNNGLYGFCIASFYLPILLGHFDVMSHLPDMLKIGMVRYADLCTYAGGDEISKMLADMLLQLRDLGCLRHIL